MGCFSDARHVQGPELMNRHILITGGAGFIGSHLADALLERGDRVRVLDNLAPQVHGPGSRRPDHLHPDVELVRGDIRDSAALQRALRGVDAVFHFAAAVGVGQSMYRLVQYTGVNTLGTAALLEALVERPVGRLVVASSMSVYGEGLYRTVDGVRCPGAERPLAQLQAHDWELRDARGEPLTPVPTPETKSPSLASVYAVSKHDQERLCLMVGQAYGIPTVALRFFNVFGPRQAPSNPYTGVLAIFAARLLNGRAPLLFEDGRQRRDFVNVRDACQACLLSLDRPEAVGRVINVGSGSPRTVLEVAQRLGRVLGRTHIEPEITERYRVGDIRHCFADISVARDLLGYRPQVSFDAGVTELAAWLEGQVALDEVGRAGQELAERGLTA
jgi:dTDP-L-rhamnose 4-epimerase